MSPRTRWINSSTATLLHGEVRESLHQSQVRKLLTSIARMKTSVRICSRVSGVRSWQRKDEQGRTCDLAIVGEKATSVLDWLRLRQAEELLGPEAKKRFLDIGRTILNGTRKHIREIQS